MTPPDANPSQPPPAPRWWQRGVGRLVIFLLAAVVLSVAVWIGVWLDRAPPMSETLQPAAVGVSEGVYLLGKLSPSAAYAVDTSAGLVLIDTGLEADAASLLEQLDTLRLDVRRLRAILLTHAHGDHTLGAAYLRERTGAVVHAGRGDCQILRDGGPREAFFSTFAMPGVTPHKTTVDVELDGDEVLAFGEATFRVLATPGHTPGSVCYLLERNGLRILFTGDVVQSLSPANKDVLGTYAAHLHPRYRGNAPDYLASLRKLRAMPVPNLVLPGHPRMDPTPQNPRLSQERWHALLDGGIAEMEAALRKKKAGE